jgi:Ni/Co efflux regulator RcnB
MKILLTASILALGLTPVAAQAHGQGHGGRGELWRDRQDIREERRELDDAYRYGSIRDIRDERDDVFEARREYREDLRDRRYRGHGYNRHAYRLPAAYGSHRWVRRHRDALLINTRNGRVVRVVRGYYG